MKKTAYFISLAMAALFVSCSGTTDDASISFSVPREIVSSVFKSSDSPAQSDYAVKKIKCTLLDGNEKEIDSQTDDIAENTNTVITFSGIPAGTKLSVSATVYGPLSNDENSPEYRLYAGESDKITVKPGNNTITLKLKKTTTTVVLYNNTSDKTIPALSYATLTSSGLSTPKELLANTNNANNSTEIVDYCFDTSNNLYAIVKQTGANIPYSIKKYEYNGSGYSNTPIIYDCTRDRLNYISHIEAADNDTLYAGGGTDSGATIAKINFTDPNEISQNGTATFTPYDLPIEYSESYSINTFCTDGTNFYIITSSGANGVTDVFLWAYTIQENEFVQVQGKYIHLASTGELAGENDYPLSSYGTSLEYRDLCYINGTLYLLVNDVSTLDVTSRGALCTFTVSDNGIAAGRIDIGYQKTAGSFSYTGDYDRASDSYPTVTQTSYFGDGKSTFYGPVKFIARKEDELVIADEGYSVTPKPYIQNKSHTQGTVSSKNAVVTYNLSEKTLNFATLDGEYFGNMYSGYFYGSGFISQ
ncbi:hypothetical protein [uncultured Treponema sp.]|uniref:hypothetical protein n=1 Tax=uncultured Treponema sp. TaxID=162155 RepID=UPI002594C633|nr:hypothetical protein [uncultured Treponema sp.]